MRTRIWNLFLTLTITVFSTLLVHEHSFAELYKVDTSAPKWCKYAKKYLTPTGQYPQIDCSNPDAVPRCIKLNNYGCLWQVGHNDKYAGTDIVGGKDGAHDGQGAKVTPSNESGHAVFKHPKWSISAKFIWFYKRSKGKSAYQLANSYLNWCDIKGTHMSNGGWHRSCQIPENERIAERKYCEDPKDKPPLPGQCKFCNCPRAEAKEWVEGTGLTINDPMDLFEPDGTPKKFMIELSLRNSINELGGYKPNDKIVKMGIRVFKKWLKENRE